MNKRSNVYEMGAFVRVVDGACDFDYPEVDVGGWQGRVFDLSEDDDGEPLLGILSDSMTLQHVPRSTVTRAERESGESSVTYLPARDVQRTSPRDTALTRYGYSHCLRRSANISWFATHRASANGHEMTMAWNP